MRLARQRRLFSGNLPAMLIILVDQQCFVNSFVLKIKLQCIWFYLWYHYIKLRVLSFCFITLKSIVLKVSLENVRQVGYHNIDNEKKLKPRKLFDNLKTYVCYV